jgi:glyoxylase-like metal-dependent hydrolase (beta-lactamase superfamily II)
MIFYTNPNLAIETIKRKNPMKIADGIEMLELGIDIMGNKSIIYPTILWTKDDTMLIDAGYPGQILQIQEGFKKIGLSLSKLDKLILTHHDIDHIGGAEDIIKNSSGDIEVISHIKEKDYMHLEKYPSKLRKLKSQPKSMPSEMKKMYEYIEINYKKHRVSVDRTVVSGENLPICGGIEVIYTPGHTPGHISLYAKKSKILIAGDLLFIKNGKLLPLPEHLNFNNELLFSSLKKLTQYDIEKIICYHSGVYSTNVNYSLRELIDS